MYEMFKRLFENFVLKATNWWFRVTTIERFLVSASFGLIAIVFGGPPLIAVLMRLIIGAVPEGYLSVQRKLEVVDGWILGICSLVIFIALVLIVLRFLGDAKIRSKKRVIVVEGRGLRDDDGSSLAEAVSPSLEGQLIPLILDLRNRLDGEVIRPEHAVENITALHRSVNQHRASVDRSNLTMVYGGLTSVPYTFMTGVLFDDEGPIKVYDWDRRREIWRDLSAKDDGLSFKLAGMEGVSQSEEAVLALGFSYPIDDVDLTTTFDYPVVRLTLNGMASDAHWSMLKQHRLAQHFLETAKQMSAIGVKRIHLVLAAPNSVVFNFGRRYDKRNLPEIIVYQYQRGQSPAYPWGVLMPVAGVDEPQVIFREGSVS